MKTINFELAKKLNDLGLLDNIETEYYYINQYKRLMTGKTSNFLNKHKITLSKTLTTEEVIEFLPIQINNYFFVLGKNDGGYWCNYLEKDEDELYILSKALFINICNKATPLEAIEEMIEYLLKNNLLGQVK